MNLFSLSKEPAMAHRSELGVGEGWAGSLGFRRLVRERDSYPSARRQVATAAEALAASAYVSLGRL